jgi:hypothetical protein
MQFRVQNHQIRLKFCMEDNEGSVAMLRRKLLIVNLIFAFLITACVSGEPSYTAHVWEDMDGNGVQGPDELPMDGIVIQIVNQSNGLLWMRPITDEDGNTFPFKAGDTCGQYSLILNVPDGYWPTTPIIVNPKDCSAAQFGLKVFP